MTKFEIYKKTEPFLPIIIPVILIITFAITRSGNMIQTIIFALSSISIASAIFWGMDELKHKQSRIQTIASIGYFVIALLITIALFVIVPQLA
ncbi:hypothetical protein [Staphylococcus equorum]|uniref:Uncharacterized protein n=1 Tax=Staphylococcus equorum TaxID=246432 RepID=A0AAP7IF85_9STAP|nr:hypothetical protein [Staphylococcus equorum]OEK58914.1 hypothetical protein ASS94_00905 [Staphylococcus equorum]